MLAKPMSLASLLKTAFLLLFVTFLLYGRALNYSFVWDDERAHLTANDHFMSGNWKAIWTPGSGLFIPVSYTLWYGIKLLSQDEKGQLQPSAFHLANLMLHAGNALLLFVFLSRLKLTRGAALAGSIFFLIHPLQVESVVWISEFRGLLATFFALLSLNLYWQELTYHRDAAALRNATGFLLATVAFVLALLSKPSVILLPFILLALVWILQPERIRLALYSLPLWLILVLPVAWLTAQAPPPEVREEEVPVYLNPFIAAYTIAFYLVKLVWPADLAPCYGITPPMLIKQATLYLSLPVLLGSAWFVYSNRKKIAPPVMAAIWFLLLAILPVSGIISFIYQHHSVVADRYVYFGMAGLGLLVAYLWEKGNSFRFIRYSFIVWLLILATISFRQVGVWKDEHTLWQTSLQVNPDQWAANYNLGVHYMKQQQVTKAIEHYTAALKANPFEKNTLENRANALARLNRFEEALADYHSALELDETDGSIYYNRALTYYRMGEKEKSLHDLKEARARLFPVDESLIKAIESEVNRPSDKK
jgi:hypothetical protein